MKLIDLVRRRHPTEEGMVPHDLYDFLHQFGNAKAALLHSILFVPDFIEVDGSILVDTFSDDVRGRFLSAKAEGKFSLQELEASFNLVDISYLFSNRDSANEEDLMLANLMVEAWRARLGMLFPGRKFSINVVPPEDLAGDYGIEFFENR